MKFDETYRLRKMARLASQAKRVLDIGWCRIPNPFLRNAEVVGLDLQAAQRPANYADTRVGDVMNLPEPFPPSSFDAVIAGEILEHVERPVELLRRCRQTLAPGGLLVLSTPNPNSPFERALTITLDRRFFYAPEHVLLIPQRWLIRIMELAGFIHVRLYSGGFPVPFFGLVPFLRPWCYQTIATGRRSLIPPVEESSDGGKGR